MQTPLINVPRTHACLELVWLAGLAPPGASLLPFEQSFLHVAGSTPLAGSSAGSLIAACYHSGMTMDQV